MPCATTRRTRPRSSTSSSSCASSPHRACGSARTTRPAPAPPGGMVRAAASRGAVIEPMVASLTFLTPLAALVALAAVLPLIAFAMASGRVTRVRRALSLSPPPRTVDIRVLGALVGVVLVLALAATQPALSRTSTARVRTDAAALFVIDTSQSMAAARGPRESTRLDRATILAERLPAAIPEVPSGVATLTDRVLPDLLPVADVAAFDATVRRAVAIESPPPREVRVRGTAFDALAGIPQSGYFGPSARRRVVVLLTDGETSLFHAASVGHAFTSSHTSFV